jgi:hypothetical protein
LKALAYFEDGDLPNLRGETRNQLRAAAVAVDVTQLPKLKLKAGIR